MCKLVSSVILSHVEMSNRNSESIHDLPSGSPSVVLGFGFTPMTSSDDCNINMIDYTNRNCLLILGSQGRNLISQ